MCTATDSVGRDPVQLSEQTTSVHTNADNIYQAHIAAHKHQVQIVKTVFPAMKRNA